jgi:hypothetical protein
MRGKRQWASGQKNTTYNGTSDVAGFSIHIRISFYHCTSQFYFVFRKSTSLVSKQRLDIPTEDFILLLSSSILCWSKSKCVLEIFALLGCYAA